MLSPLRAVFESLEAPVSQGLMSTIFLLCNILPELFHGEIKGLSISIQSAGLPIGAGLGSSAAFSVALAGALLLLRERLFHDVSEQFRQLQLGLPSDAVPVPVTVDGAVSPPTDILSVINEWSYSSEMVIHGMPSGLDNNTSCIGTDVSIIRHPTKVVPL